MPTYDYKCTQCDCDFEKLTSMATKDEATCPKCGSSQVKRLLSAFNIGTGKGGHANSEPAICGLGSTGGGCPATCGFRG